MRLYDETASFKFAPGGSKTEYLRNFGRDFAAKFIENCDQLFSGNRGRIG